MRLEASWKALESSWWQGEKAFTLHHRFYLHLDRSNQLWLSAEDGCEGRPAKAAERKLFGLFG